MSRRAPAITSSTSAFGNRSLPSGVSRPSIRDHRNSTDRSADAPATEGREQIERGRLNGATAWAQSTCQRIRHSRTAPAVHSTLRRFAGVDRLPACGRSVRGAPPSAHRPSSETANSSTTPQVMQQERPDRQVENSTERGSSESALTLPRFRASIKARSSYLRRLWQIYRDSGDRNTAVRAANLTPPRRDRSSPPASAASATRPAGASRRAPTGSPDPSSR